MQNITSTNIAFLRSHGILNIQPYYNLLNKFAAAGLKFEEFFGVDTTADTIITFAYTCG